MKVGLLDVDGHNYPNLALMKLSAWHKKCGDTVEFVNPPSSYDRIYLSKVFTWTKEPDLLLSANEVWRGGSGYPPSMGNQTLSNTIEHICPDYSIYNCKSAYGFLTRGCMRHCDWCIVPEKEGSIRSHADIDEFISDKKSAILMDNNVLGISHGIHQIEKIAKMGIAVDFNQGLDARLIDDSIARLLSKVKWLSAVRLACDSSSQIKIVGKAVETLRWHNVVPRRYFVYVLVRDIADAYTRIRFLKGINCDPFAQTYRSDTVLPTQAQQDFCRWVNHKAIFKSTTWEEYKQEVI